MWYNSKEAQYSFDQSKSLSLLSAIGITKGSDGKLHYANGTAVTLSLWTDTDNTEDTIGAGAIQKNLQQLGFTVNLQTVSISSIVGDYNQNLNGIRSAVILATSNPPVWGNPYLDSLPAWDVYWLATTPSHHWEYPPSADTAYQSNYSAFLATANQTLEQQYLNNIQALNAQYLPTIVLAYPDALWAYNTQHWSNWPSGYIEFGAQIMNNTAFAELQPAGTSSNSTTASQTNNSTSSSSAPQTTTSPPETTLVTSSSTSTSSQPASSITNLAYIGIAGVVILAVAGATFVLRRRPR